MAPVLLLLALSAAAGDIPAGKIVEDVKCAADASQSYALYLPSAYSPRRAWPVILAFDPAARSRIPVERYQAAAEMYGYIVAGSNNSRNGSWQVSTAAVEAMSADVGQRFAIDAARVYTAGMSGGARVAMAVALSSGRIAGVIASSAGYPDQKPRKSVPFAVFGTAGTEDFNYWEVRKLGRDLTSPHRIVIFPGGHAWLSSELAIQAVEWLEIQAMKSGRSPRDEARLDRIFARRTAALDALASDAERFAGLQSLADDFDGLEDVSGFAARAGALARDKRVRDAVKRERDEEARENREIREILALEAQLSSAGDETRALTQLRDHWRRLAATSGAPDDSPSRRMARRMLRGLLMGVSERVHDPAYLDMLKQFRPGQNTR
jgi:dienelactone hydrolase